MLSIETILLTGAYIVSFAAVFFISRKKAAEASFIFMLTQFFSWVLGLVVVQFGWLEYPVHELAKANSTSFLFEYFLMPVLAIFFILHYPSGKPVYIRILYFASIISGFTLIEVIVEKYTMIIEYHAWTWYWTWISMSLVFYVVTTIYKWFFRQKKIFSI